MDVPSAEAPASAGMTGFALPSVRREYRSENRMFGMIKLRLVDVNTPWADVRMNVKSYKEM